MHNTLLRSGLFLLFCAALFSSCRQKNITCIDGTIQVHPVGFSERDFDSAVVIKYTQGGSFSTVVDSTHSVLYNAGSYSQDTASIAVYVTINPDSSSRVFIVPGYDYKIILPVLGRTFTITNIELSGQTHQSYTTGLVNDEVYRTCYNSVVRATVDGNVFTGTSDMQAISVEIVK